MKLLDQFLARELWGCFDFRLKL